MRSGWWTASHMPVIAAEGQPGEVGTVDAEFVERLDHVRPRSASVHGVDRRAAGRDPPCPRWSMRTTRNCSAAAREPASTSRWCCRPSRAGRAAAGRRRPVDAGMQCHVVLLPFEEACRRDRRRADSRCRRCRRARRGCVPSRRRRRRGRARRAVATRHRRCNAAGRAAPATRRATSPAPRCSSGAVRKQRGDQSGRLRGRGACGDRGDRVLLVRHGRRAARRSLAAPRRPRSARAARDRRRSCRSRRRRCRARRRVRRRRCDRCATRRRERRDRARAANACCTATPCGCRTDERARRAAELGGQCLAHGRQSRDAAVEGATPAGRDRPERRRHGRLQQRACRHRGVAVFARQFRAAVGGVADGCGDHADACLATSISAVSRMSWLVAPRCTAAAASAPARTSTRCRNSRDERDRRGCRPAPRVARVPRCRGDGSHRTRRRSRARSASGMIPTLGARPRKRRLGLHKASTIAASSVAATTAVVPKIASNSSLVTPVSVSDREEGRLGLALQPMSKRSASPSSIATRRSRVPAGIVCSTGSVAFAWPRPGSTAA